MVVVFEVVVVVAVVIVVVISFATLVFVGRRRLVVHHRTHVWVQAGQTLRLVAEVLKADQIIERFLNFLTQLVEFSLVPPRSCLEIFSMKYIHFYSPIVLSYNIISKYLNFKT